MINPNFSVRIDSRRERCFESGESADEYYSILEQAQAIPSLVMSGQGCVHQTNGHRRALASYCALGMDSKGQMTRPVSIACLNMHEFTGNRRQKCGQPIVDVFTTPLYDPASARSDPLEIVELARKMVWDKRHEFEHMQLVAAGHGRRILFCISKTEKNHLVMKVMMQTHLVGSQQAPGRVNVPLAEQFLEHLLTKDPTRQDRCPDCMIFESVHMNSTPGIDQFAMAVLTALSITMSYNLIQNNIHFWMACVPVTFEYGGTRHVVSTTLKFQHRMQHAVPFEKHDKLRLTTVPAWRIALNQPSLVDDEIEDERMLPVLSTPVRESMTHVQRTSLWNQIIA